MDEPLIEGVDITLPAKAMDNFTITWDIVVLPVIALTLIVIWGWWQWSVIRDFWKQFRSQSDKSNKLHILNSFALVALGLILVILFFGVLAAIGKLGVSLLSLGEEDDESLRWLGLTFFGLLTALGGIIGAPLAIIRMNTAERQTRINEREYTTSLLNQAAEHISTNLSGSVEPNIPIRVGGLLTLERIAQDNIDDYHVQIMEIICTYIRRNSPCAESIASEVPPPREAVGMDIQFAIDILSRRTPAQVNEERQWEGHRLDLNQANLTGADFVRRNRESDFSKASFRNCSLVNAIFDGANLTGASLAGANLNGAYLIRAHLTETFLTEAHLREARLREAHLQEAYLLRADLAEANMEDANLTEAYLIDANLSGAVLMNADLTGAKLPRANLMKAILTGASLKRARLGNAILTGANLEAVDFRGADLDGADLQGANLDGADLRGAKVTHANFRDASMKRTKPEESMILDYAQKREAVPTHEEYD